MAFRGQFEYTLDAKNRLTIPPKFRGPLSDGVVLAKELDTCVSIWPMVGWLAHTEHAGAYEGQLDSAGRLMLPHSLIERVGLEKEVTMIGNFDSIEIWDRGHWAKRQPELDSQASEIAQRLATRDREGR